MAKVIQWVLDTRKLWPEASKTAELEHIVSLPLLELRDHVSEMLTSLAHARPRAPWI